MVSRRGAVGALVASALRGQNKGTRMFGDAVAYERFMGRWSRLVAPRLVDIAQIPDGARVLDVGSGTGSLAFTIAELRGRSHVVGVDPSREYVDYANSTNPFPDRVSFRVGDAQQLRLPDADFQASLSLLVFNFIPDARKALSELLRVTESGGRISAAVWDYGGGMRMLRVFWDAAVSVDPTAEKLDEKHMPLCRAGELAHLWKLGGLDDIQEAPLDITMRFTSFPDYWDAFLLGQGPAGAYVRGLAAGRLAALRAEVKRRLLVTGDSSPFALTARAWAVRGNVPKRR